MTKIILAAVMALGFSAFAADTHGTAPATTTPPAEGTMPAEGTDAAAAAGEHMDAKGKKMAKKAAKAEKKEKKEHAH